MRIITGSAKGRRIKTPEGMNTRPTSDRVKESLFNIISNKIYGSEVLDLFAGTGNLGLEALSRGAVKCTFVENNRNAFDILQDNIYSLGFNDKSESYNQDAFIAIKKSSALHKRYDVIFLDPPYSKGLIEKSIEMIGKEDVLNNDAIIISEYDENDKISDKIGSIIKYRAEKYGRTYLGFWTKEEEK